MKHRSIIAFIVLAALMAAVPVSSQLLSELKSGAQNRVQTTLLKTLLSLHAQPLTGEETGRSDWLVPELNVASLRNQGRESVERSGRKTSGRRHQPAPRSSDGETRFAQITELPNLYTADGAAIREALLQEALRWDGEHDQKEPQRVNHQGAFRLVTATNLFRTDENNREPDAGGATRAPNPRDIPRAVRHRKITVPKKDTKFIFTPVSETNRVKDSRVELTRACSEAYRREAKRLPAAVPEVTRRRHDMTTLLAEEADQIAPAEYHAEEYAPASIIPAVLPFDSESGESTW